MNALQDRHLARVVLASQSPRRRDLLTLVGVTHEVRPANLDEAILPDEQPIPHCERLARAKARFVAQELEADAVVIGSDTIVVIDDTILGKPTDRRHAERMLRTLSGRTHTVHTAVAVAFRGELRSQVETVNVTFRTLDDDLIARYVQTGEPMDKAGAYGVQGFGATLVEGIDGDYFAVMGLPLRRLVALLEELDIRYAFGPLTTPNAFR